MAAVFAGTWRFESSTNDEAIAESLSFPLEKWQEIKAAKPEVTYTKVADDKYKVRTVDILNTSELELNLTEEKSETTSKFKYPDGTEAEVKVQVTKINDYTWKEVFDYGQMILEITKVVNGDTLTHTFTCKDQPGTFVFKRVEA